MKAEEYPTAGRTSARLPRPLSRLLRRLLERDPGEIDRRAAHFAIGRPEARRLVSRLGEAFIGGYNAMLRCESLAAVAIEGAAVESHFRPFFFEGAAMGYLPRGWIAGGCTRQSAERDLVTMHPAFLYLYYVGLGFWMAMRHPRRPASIETLAPWVNPMYLPLCYDGFGFKVGFFGDPARPSVRRLLERCPAARRGAMHQGFGRALFFVHMDDEAAFQRQRDAAAGAHRADMEQGRSLALAFTGVDRPATIAAHLAAAADDADLRARLTGVTWALAARAMSDPDYFQRCVGSAPDRWNGLLMRLPVLCHEALAAARDYDAWQARTAGAVMAAHTAWLAGGAAR